MKQEENKISESPSAIDFHAPEFNVVDDLNDWAPGCLSYEPLGEVITADMRHQMERRRDRPCGVPSGDAAADKENEATAILPESQEKAPPLTVVSHGRTLVIDTDARRAEECATRLDAQGLPCAVVLTKAGIAGQGYWGPLRADSLSVAGAFGGFTASAVVNGDRKPLAELLADKELSFDLVLDLQPEPSYAGELLPMGYYAPGRDPSGLEGTLTEMTQMRGRFTKPQFTAFREARCIHSLSRKRECRRCLEVCPFGAIQSVDRKITVNSYVCQGCGACALACPTDAIQLREPSRQDLLETVHRAVEAGWTNRNQPPALFISDRETAGETAADGRIHLKMEQVGHVGLELLLAAMACGADRIAVACGPQYPAGIRKAVEQQVRMADAILQGLGMPGDIVRLNGGAKDEPLPLHLPVLKQTKDTLSCAPDGRTGVRLAVQHLYERSGAKQPALPMPEGFPFGAVAVDSASCTLCMACAVACPAGALTAGSDTPRLTFIESLCHQCGLCKDACPERAIQLAPRILCDPAAVNTPAVVREAEPFRCVVCGAPFATQPMVSRMLEKLAGHWMYAEERQRRRLQMCHICRTRDAFQSEDRKTWLR
ncbi:MAG TPA: 4Fe-4S binding protein [Syntrophales bacterium]|nr:4Fe-4S binding protein [Syntrophales bacterium]